ncbi:PEP-CTERM sorting domain-containing protein [bacterium]|nr:PEP-CTERM sorting domain-containing protein [bacterium]
MKSTFVVTILAAMVLAFAAPSRAALINDYFEYGSVQTDLVGLATADTTGWGAAGWSLAAGETPQYVPGGFLPFVSTNGAGVAYGEDVAYSNWYAGGQALGFLAPSAFVYRCAVTRALNPPLSGTTWISLIVTSSWIDAVGDPFTKNVGLLEVNGDSNDSFGVMSCGVDPANSTYRWYVSENGVVTSNNVPYNRRIIVLVVAKLETDYSGANDRLTLWTLNRGDGLPSGRTVADLGTPRFAGAGDQDIWGSSLSSIGLYLKSHNATGRNIMVHSLRISHGGISDDSHVAEVLSGEVVPEPAALGLLGIAGVAALARRKH